MPFDGVDHRGGLIPPYYAHSNARATGVALSMALRNAYEASRKEGMVIGYQTFKQHGTNVFEYMYDSDQIGQTSFVDVAQFGCRAPVQATHISVWFNAYCIPFNKAILRMKLDVKETSSLSDTTAASLSADVSNSTYWTEVENVGTGGSGDITAFGTNDLQTVSGSIAISAAPGNFMQLTVSAYCKDEDNNAAVWMIPMGCLATFACKD